jgi:hypothetical protein
MQGEVEGKNCLDLYSKLPYITDRLQPNFHYFKRKHR